MSLSASVLASFTMTVCSTDLGKMCVQLREEFGRGPGWDTGEGGGGGLGRMSKHHVTCLMLWKCNQVAESGSDAVGLLPQRT